MNERPSGSSSAVENWESFKVRLKPFSVEDRDKIDRAYDISKDAHRGQLRIGGDRYFEHPRGVALILLDECQIRNASVICGALLHDSVEDTAIFSDPSKKLQSEWINEARVQISKSFSPQTAEIVIALTEPVVDGVEIRNRSQAKDIKYLKLRVASSEALLVKMADRLHNLRTFCPKPGELTPSERIRETEDILLPIFQRALDTYPSEARHLLDEIDKAIGVLRSNVK